MVEYRKTLKTAPALALNSYDAVTNKKQAQEHAQNPDMQENQQENRPNQELLDNQVLVVEVTCACKHCAVVKNLQVVQEKIAEIAEPCMAQFQPCVAQFQPCVWQCQPCVAPFQPCVAPFQPCVAPFQPCVASYLYHCVAKVFTLNRTSPYKM